MIRLRQIPLILNLNPTCLYFFIMFLLISSFFISIFSDKHTLEIRKWKKKKKRFRSHIFTNNSENVSTNINDCIGGKGTKCLNVHDTACFPRLRPHVPNTGPVLGLLKAMDWNWRTSYVLVFLSRPLHIIKYKISW